LCNKAGSDLVQLLATCAAPATGEGCISPKTELPSLTSQTYYFLSRLWVLQGMRPTLLGISSVPPSTFWDFHFTTRHYGIPTLPPAGRENIVLERFNRYRKLNFPCRHEKQCFSIFFQNTPYHAFFDWLCP